jgi:hypothetical protein
MTKASAIVVIAIAVGWIATGIMLAIMLDERTHQLERCREAKAVRIGKYPDPKSSEVAAPEMMVYWSAIQKDGFTLYRFGPAIGDDSYDVQVQCDGKKCTTIAQPMKK